MTTTSTDAGRAVKISGPAGLAGSIPILLGFPPRESAVLVCFAGPRRTMAPAIRMDLPTGAAHARALAAFIALQAQQHADQVALVLFTDEPSGRRRGRPSFPRDAFVRQCVRRLEAVDVPVFDAMLVRNGVVWSYLHHWPTEPGYPVPDPDDPAMSELRARSALAGRAMLPDRADLVSAVAGPVGPAARAAEQELIHAEHRWRELTTELDHADAEAAGVTVACAALDELRRAFERRLPLPAAVVADFVLALRQPTARDEVVRRLLAEWTDAPLPLLLKLLTCTPDLYAAHLATVTSIVAYRAGDGALAQVTVDRALVVDPDNPMANLLVQLFGSGLRPELLDSMLGEEL